MKRQRPITIVVRRIVITLVLSLLPVPSVMGQNAPTLQPPGRSGGVQAAPVRFHLNSATQQLNMLVNTSRLVTLDQKIERMLVNNPEVVRATPLAPNQVQVSALAAGVTQVNLWDEAGRIYTVDLVVTPDPRQLEFVLKEEFPEASLTVRPLASSVMISGYVPRADMIHPIKSVAADYYPNVVDNIKVGGAQQILLHCKVLEVSRSKLRRLGVDLGNINGNDSIFTGIAGLVSGDAIGSSATLSGLPTLQLGVITNNNSFFAFIDALRSNSLAKILSEPSVVTISGRPARFTSGGEFPIIVPQAQGSVSVDFRQFGTIVDFVPIVLGNGRIRLEVRPEISALDAASGVSFLGTQVPGLRTRGVDTACELEAGQTFVLAGLIQTQVEASNTGLPWLSDLPWVGSAFRTVSEEVNEIELLILVTPEFIGPLNPHEVPCNGPGTMTTTPTTKELFLRGYIEVPNQNCDPCGDGQAIPQAAPTGYFSHSPGYNQLPGMSQGAPVTVQRGGAHNVPSVANSRYTNQPYNAYGGTSPQYPAGQHNVRIIPQNQIGPPQIRTELLGPTGYDVLD